MEGTHQLEDLELIKYLQDSPQLDDTLENGVLDQFYISDDLWKDIQFPELTDHDLFSNLHPLNDLSCLATPPLSPPDSDDTLSTPSPKDMSANVSSSLSTSHSPLPTSNSSLSGGTMAANLSLPPSITTNSSGQLVQVLKSGESVPISHLFPTAHALSNLAFTVPTEAAAPSPGQKRPHPDNSNLAESKVSKRQQRLIKNRESACLSRKKKKEYVHNLELKLKEAAAKNITLLKENNHLRSKVVELEKENQILRTGTTTTPRPAVILMVALCFTIALLPLKSYILSDSSKPVTSLMINPTGRALMSLPDNSLSDIKSLAEKSRPVRWNTKSVRQQMMLRYPAAGNEEKTICQCPSTTTSEKYNKTRVLKLNTDLASVSFGQGDINRLISSTYDDVEKRSLIIITNGNDKDERSLTDNGCQCRPTHGLASLYKSLKKSMTRDLSHFYLISFKDHLLLNAPNHNTTLHPSLSVIIPAHNDTHTSPPGYMSMLQLNCKVIDSNIFHMEIP